MITQFKEPSRPRIEPLAQEKIPADFAGNNGQWLVECATGLLGVNGVSYALIHADDGVLWGLVNSNQLSRPSPSDWSPELRTTTIQQCRIFGTKGELFIWREAEGQWLGRVVIEDANVTYEQIEEAQIMYGSRAGSSQSVPAGFTPIFEVTTGIRQIVPVTITQDQFDKGQRVVLNVKHYLSADQEGQAIIKLSRLVLVQISEVKQ